MGKGHQTTDTKLNRVARVQVVEGHEDSPYANAAQGHRDRLSRRWARCNPSPWNPRCGGRDAGLLSQLFDWRRLSVKRYGFSLARLEATDVKLRVREAGFQISRYRYAWRPYPFFRLLPRAWRLPLLTRVNRSEALSRFGSELWLVLNKN